MEKDWLESALTEFLDRYEEIEGEAGQEAQMQQNWEAGRELMMERARQIFKKHWKGEAGDR